VKVSGFQFYRARSAAFEYTCSRTLDHDPVSLKRT